MKKWIRALPRMDFSECWDILPRSPFRTENCILPSGNVASRQPLDARHLRNYSSWRVACPKATLGAQTTFNRWCRCMKPSCSSPNLMWLHMAILALYSLWVFWSFCWKASQPNFSLCLVLLSSFPLQYQDPSLLPSFALPICLRGFLGEPHP